MIDMTQLKLPTPAEREAIRLRAEAQAKAEMAPIHSAIDLLVRANSKLRLEIDRMKGTSC